MSGPVLYPGEDSPAWISALPAAQEASQLFITACAGMDSTGAVVSMHEKDGHGAWKQLLSSPAFVGREGLCRDADHREGCARTPIGVYRFNRAFGIAPDPGCALPYVQVNEYLWWSGDPDRLYNRMADIREVPDLDPADSEHLADYDPEYRYCLSISFNEECVPGRGSAIFLHCSGPFPFTGGCVAVPEGVMKRIMRAVRKDCVVVIDTREALLRPCRPADETPQPK